MRPTFRLVCVWASIAGVGLRAINEDALAGEKPPTRLDKTAGLVYATRDGTGKVTAVEFRADPGGLYRVTLDEHGAALGETMHGEKTRVTGTVLEKGEEAWLTVVRYEGLEAAANEEHRRRMRPKGCNWCTIAQALANARLPKDLAGAAAVDGRPFSYKGQIGAWTRDERFLWAATDNEVFQIDLAAKRLVKSYGPGDGLPDQVVYQLLSDGTTLWMVYRGASTSAAAGGGVAALTIGKDRIVDLPALRCNFGRLAAGQGGVWVIADTGTFRLQGPTDTPARAPAIPTAARIAKNVVDGIWLPRWTRQTAHFIYSPVCVAGRVYVGSYGDIYGLDGATWGTVGKGGWEPCAGAGRLWFLSSQGLAEYEPETKNLTVHPFLKAQGQGKRLLVTGSAVWVALEPSTTPQGFEGGGLARLDLASRTWQTFPEINGRKADHVTCLEEVDGAVWAFNVEGEYRQKPAHPGMTYVKRNTFDTSGFCLHRFGGKQRPWETIPLGLPTFEQRLIVGDSGALGRDVILPQTAEDISVGTRRIFGVMHLFPKTYFCGYYPCVEQLALRGPSEAGWTAKFEHRPEELGLQGEQPLTLNIANIGRDVYEGLGHDNVLGMFMQGNEHWVVTEGCVGRFDVDGSRWQKVLEPAFRFYWRASAGLDDGTSLYLGSDRGMVTRLDPRTGRFEVLTCLNQRSISRIAKDRDGSILVASAPSPLGMMPVQLRGKLRAEDWTAARFDGRTWTEADAQALPAEGPQTWVVTRGNERRRGGETDGNFLSSAAPSGPTPRFYLKGVYYPKFLCASPDGNRLWVSTYSGVLRLDGVKAVIEAGP